MVSRASLRTAAAVGCAAALLAAGTAGDAVTQGPGAPGIGDAYFPSYGNGGYDVSHYDIRLRYDPATDRLSGTTTIVAKPTQDLTRFNLDFALTTNAVRVNGAVASFAAEGAELVVTPPTLLRAGSLMTVVVTYTGIPSEVEVDGYTAWTRTPDGGLAVGQPEIAWWWYPSNDHPRDKATFDISVAVPTGHEVLANGVLTGQLPQPGNQTRWSWRTTRPMATYLAFLAIGQYEVVTGTGSGGQPMVNAYGENLGEYEFPAKASIERTPEIVDFLSGVLGPYPFESQGGVVPVFGPGFALETQTRSVYDRQFFRRGSNTYVVVHENAHQWFGDSVSVRSWRDIWLNEGFATYLEWMWSEVIGEGTAQEVFEFEYAFRPVESTFWQVLPGDPGPNRIFNSAVYDRGAMTVHALRLAVGDEAFLSILRTWVAEQRFGNGTIEQFMALSERISGQDLDALFRTWLFTAGRPELPGLAARTAAEVPRPRSIDMLHLTHETLHATR
ncbi:MAG TPA: M1 family metallopeptidase [Pseudonocardiaceae bacterium]